jgi:hypothetical protein
MAERELTALKQAYGVKPSALSRLWRTPAESGMVTYCVAPSPAAAPATATAEQRNGKRRRTRLRSGKIIDRANRFLIDVAIIDRSSAGLRLRLVRDQVIPEVFRLFDDETGLVLGARLVWRRHAIVGVQLDAGGPLPASPRQIANLRGKFYAMRD